MRFLTGLVVGFLLAIAVAYWHDRSVAGTPDVVARELVNWDEFGRSFSAATDWVQEQVAGLVGSMRHRS